MSSCSPCPSTGPYFVYSLFDTSDSSSNPDMVSTIAGQHDASERMCCLFNTFKWSYRLHPYQHTPSEHLTHATNKDLAQTVPTALQKPLPRVIKATCEAVPKRRKVKSESPCLQRKELPVDEESHGSAKGISTSWCVWLMDQVPNRPPNAATRKEFKQIVAKNTKFLCRLRFGKMRLDEVATKIGLKFPVLRNIYQGLTYNPVHVRKISEFFDITVQELCNPSFQPSCKDLKNGS